MEEDLNELVTACHYCTEMGGYKEPGWCDVVKADSNRHLLCVVCLQCGASGDPGEDREAAIELWNSLRTIRLGLERQLRDQVQEMEDAHHDTIGDWISSKADDAVIIRRLKRKLARKERKRKGILRHRDMKLAKIRKSLAQHLNAAAANEARLNIEKAHLARSRDTHKAACKDYDQKLRAMRATIEEMNKKQETP